MITQDLIVVETFGQGLIEVTDRVANVVRSAGVDKGLCTVFVQHTSASLLIQENADPSVCRDLEAWLNRLVLESDSLYTHTSEGPDDMPAHVKSAITTVTLGIPITSGYLALGSWQGIFLWEHRRRGRARQLFVHVA